MTKNLAKYLLAITLLSFVFFLTRLINLDTLPVFGDEAIYLRWSQLIRNVETLRFIPLTDGKQPLFMWIVAVLLKFFTNPLIAGRFLSVISGYFSALFLSFVFLIYLNYDSNNKNIFSFLFESLKKYWALSLIPFVVYLFLPFSFFFDRLSLPDNLLSTLGIVSLFLILLISKFPRLDLTLILGGFLGLAWITKSPAIYFIILSFVGIKKIYLPIISFIISFLIYNLLRLGPQFHQLALRNMDYVWSPLEVIKHPLDPFIPHLKDLFVIYFQYISLPLFVLMFLGLVLSIINRQKVKRVFIFIAFGFLFPLISNLALSRVFTGRYFLYTNPFFIIFFSLALVNFFKYGFEYFQSKILIFSFVALCFLPNIFWIYKVSTNPFLVKLPLSESGYTEGWTAGWGIKDVSDYLINRASNHNVIVGTEGYFGTLPDGLQIYTDGVKSLTVFGVESSPSVIPEKLIDAKNFGDDVYLLLNSSKGNLTISSLERLKVIEEYVKPDGTSLILYQLI